MSKTPGRADRRPQSLCIRVTPLPLPELPQENTAGGPTRGDGNVQSLSSEAHRVLHGPPSGRTGEKPRGTRAPEFLRFGATGTESNQRVSQASASRSELNLHARLHRLPGGASANRGVGGTAPRSDGPRCTP